MSAIDADPHGDQAWSLAVGTAALASVVAATLAAALYHFYGVNRVVLVGLTAVVGLVLGLRLPAAAPARPRRGTHRSSM